MHSEVQVAWYILTFIKVNLINMEGMVKLNLSLEFAVFWLKY